MLNFHCSDHYLISHLLKGHQKEKNWISKLDLTPIKSFCPKCGGGGVGVFMLRCTNYTKRDLFTEKYCYVI